MKGEKKMEENVMIVPDEEIGVDELEENLTGEVIDGRQAHAALPAVNGLRRFKPEIGLKVADGQTPFLPKTKDVRAGCAQVDDREGMLLHHVRLLHIRL